MTIPIFVLIGIVGFLAGYAFKAVGTGSLHNKLDVLLNEVRRRQ